MTTLLDAGADLFCALILALYYKDDVALSTLLEYDCTLFSSPQHISKIGSYNRLHSYNSVLSFALGIHEATTKAKTIVTGRLVGHRRRLIDWAVAMLSSVERQNACMETISDGRLLGRFSKPIVLTLRRKGIMVPDVLRPGERQRSVYPDPNMALLIAQQISLSRWFRGRRGHATSDCVHKCPYWWRAMGIDIMVYWWRGYAIFSIPKSIE